MNRHRKILIFFLLISLVFSSFFLGAQSSKTLHKRSQKQNIFALGNVHKQSNTSPSTNRSANGNIQIPILVYHDVSAYIGGKATTFPAAEFSDQMSFLKQGDFTTLSLDELYACLNGYKVLPKNPIVITFDDSKSNIYKNVFPMLVDYGFKAAIFVTTDMIDRSSSYLSSENIRQMYSFGIDIGTCSPSHKELFQLPYSEELAELKNSKDALREVLGKEIKYVAYPYGAYNQNTIKAARIAGYKVGFAEKGGLTSRKDEMLALKRIIVYTNEPVETFKKTLKVAK